MTNRMNVQLTRLFMLSIAVTACGGGSGGTLEREDVTDIPPGDAVGSEVSGEYELELYTTDCLGRCPVIEAGIFVVTLCDVGELDSADASVTQADGELVLDSTGLVIDRLTGGIAADGTFEIGGWGTQYGGAVEIVVLSTGTADGESFTGTAESRGRGEVEGELIDCTVMYDVTGTRTAPPK
jgi:hypothetical protein